MVWRFIIKESLRNEQIVEAQVRLIGPEGEQLGMVSGAEANAKAREYGLDLVMIAPDAKPPVCKIMDYGKHKFDQLKKLKDQKKAQKTAKLKEMSLSMTIGDHDLQTKANQVSKFLQDGSKVKVNIRMSGRQMARPQQGIDIMTKKMTKRDLFNLAIAETTNPTLIAFFNHELELLDRKNSSNGHNCP